MPTDFEDANVLLLNDPIEVEEADVDTAVNVESPDQLQRFLDQEEEQLRDKVDKIVESGADVVFCQKGIDDLAQHYLAKEGILAVRRTKKSDLTFLKNVLGAPIVSDLDSLTADDLAIGTVSRDTEEGLFYVEGEDAHGVTLLLYGTTEHVVDELERGIQGRHRRGLDDRLRRADAPAAAPPSRSSSRAVCATTPTPSRAASSSPSRRSPTRSN